MLIEVDNWTKDVLWNTSDYIVKPPFKIVDHKPYVNVEDLVQAISDLTDEVDRQYEVISKMGKDVQIYFKGNQLITLNEEDIKYIQRADELTEEDSGIKDNCIEKGILIEIIKQLVRQNEKQWQEIRELREN